MRIRMLDWYEKFKDQIRNQFVSTIKNKFFETKDVRER